MTYRVVVFDEGLRGVAFYLLVGWLILLVMNPVMLVGFFEAVTGPWFFFLCFLGLLGLYANLGSASTIGFTHIFVVLGFAALALGPGFLESAAKTVWLFSDQLLVLLLVVAAFFYSGMIKA